MSLVSPDADQPDLAVVSLSVLGDARPLPDLQPPLLEGIHLRWAFPREKGFPWYGFYLFRRLTPSTGTQTCASSQLAGLPPGPRTSPDLTVPLGTFHSDTNLVLTDDFAPTGTVELDLSGRQFIELQMDSANPRSFVDVTIGFVSDVPASGGSGGGSGGSGGGIGSSSSLGTTGGAAADCGCGCAHAAISPVAEKVVALGPGQFVATFGYDNMGTSVVSMPIGADNGFYPAPAGRGQPTLFRPGRQSSVFSVTFDGRPLTWRLAGHTVTVSAADAGGGTGDGTGGGGGGGPTTADGILVTALRGDAVIQTVRATGHAGEIKHFPFAFEEIDTIRISSGPARLIDVCARATSDGAGAGWAPAPGLTQPILLPVQSPNYPLQQGPSSQADSLARAIPRISYAFPLPSPPNPPGSLDTNEWTNPDTFAAIFDSLAKIVSAGPAAGITDFVENVQAAADPNDPDAPPPQSTQQSSLELLLGASVNPAMAQMLGLYWIDTGVVEGQSYDYTLVADYTNACNGNAQTALGLVTARSFDNVTAYQRLGVLHAVGLPLSSPQNVAAYSLPLGGVPAGAPADVAGQVGLLWDVPTISATSPRLARDAAILFHVWRHVYGTAAPSSSAEALAFDLVTELPVAPGALRTQGPDGPLQGWPAVNLFAFDGPLVEGWYGYRTSGIDLFGRYSARSAPASWANAGAIQQGDPSIAVHIMDTTPPPAPTAVQAWMLEPGDTFVIQDAPYQTWRQANPSALGLRVRWIWTGKQMLQAPDAKEFRVYVQPGSSMADAADVESWARRIAVVDLGEAIVGEVVVALALPSGGSLTGVSATANGAVVTLADVAAAGLTGVGVAALELELPAATGGRTRFSVVAIDAANNAVTLDAPPALAGGSAWTLGIVERTYEIFLPGAAFAAPVDFTLPWAPTPQSALAYGLVGVTAADDKTNELAVDVFASRSPPSPLVPRPGNEGAVGGPATVVQVLRDTPAPPALPIDQQTLSATRADFQSHSFFNLHFAKAADLSTHVYRALDESLFANDASRRFPTATPPPPPPSPLSSVSAQDLGWTETGRYQNAVNQIASLTRSGYASLLPDALRLLASLKSNAAAFTCLTSSPLDPATPDQLGKSDDRAYVPSAALSSYEDTLDGRATNVYFYRTAKVNRAHTVGDLGVSTPPVLLPPTSIAVPPTLLGALGDDGAVVLTWRAVTDPLVAAYRVYRASTVGAADDVQMMDLVTTVSDHRPPASRTAPLTFSDTTVRPYQGYFYRVTAVLADSSDSPASAVLSSRAFDGAPPPEPSWDRAQWVKLDGAGAEQPFSASTPGLIPALAIKLSYARASVARVLIQAVDGTHSRAVSAWLTPASLADTASTIEGYVTILNPSFGYALVARAVGRGGQEASSQPRAVPAP